jgi:predicted transcriptional regulator of viral defense system
MEIDYSKFTVYETTPADYYTRNCNICRDPYHLGFTGTKVTTSKGISNKISCILNTIEHCFSYDNNPF